MAYFHYRCGDRITLLNDNCTAVRNDSDFDNGLVITAEPLVNDVLFEIKIDRKVDKWSGSVEIGVVDCDPLHFDFPPSCSRIQSQSWIMSVSSFFKNGHCVIERYGYDLDSLNQDDRVGLMRTSEGELIFYINGESQGVAAENLPSVVYGIVDVYGKCVQVCITSPNFREHNNDDCLSGSSVLAIDNDILNVTLGGDLSELSMSSSNSLDIRMDMNVSLSLPEECPRPDRLKFHDRCGSLVKLSNGNRSAERRRPLDEFNNGVVMTHRALRDSELFEIRIDRLVDKWSGSIEMGITTHNPNTLVFPATMTNMRSGTIMMSGCGILTNGKGTKREYGNFNLDELSEGDRVGMMRKPDGNLHYFINGLDQGVAATRVPSTVWGVIDLYGMTIKVSIVERDEREEQNLITRKNTRDEQVTLPEPPPLPDYYDRLTFHPNCGTHAQVINNGRTAHRPNAADDFNNGVVLTARPLKTGELFEVRLERVVTKWAGSIEIGVTTHSPVDLEFPFTMTNVRSGTWVMTGSGIMHNGTIVLEQYGMNLDRLTVGDRVGVVRKESGMLHFFVNGVDQGAAASNVPEKIYGVIDLYGQAVEASIVDICDYASPDTINSSLSNTTFDLRFHHVHGKNAIIVNGALTAFRPRALTEFNNAIVFSSRPLRDGELFEIVIDSTVDRWSGSIELGVTALRPDDIELPSTATDLTRDTWMLSSSSVMENGKTVKNSYPMDLDNVGDGVRLGVVRSSDTTLEFYRDGVAQGPACFVPAGPVYAVVDLYGQCAQVSIPYVCPLAPLPSTLGNCPRSDTSVSLQAVSVVQPPVATDLHVFSEFHNKSVTLSDGGRLAKKGKDGGNSAIVFSGTPLVQDEMYEFSVMTLLPHLAGTLIVGITETPPSTCNGEMPTDCYYLTGNELKHNNKTLQLFTPSLNWLNAGDRLGLLRTHDNSLKIFINSEEVNVTFPQLPDIAYAVINLRGGCSSVAVTSHKSPLTPLNGVKLQDSFDLLLEEQDLLSSDVPLIKWSHNISNKELGESSGLNNATNLTEGSVFWEFHENHGRNIELMENRSAARRVASYNQGLVVVNPALEIGGRVEVIVDQLEFRWQACINVGVVCGLADRLNLPVNALAFKPPCCIIANDWISINGFKSRSNYGQKLGNLSVGDRVGLVLTATGLKLLVNGIEEEILLFSVPVGQPIHAIFDLYGQCQQIKILNDVATVQEEEEEGEVSPSVVECEKADLESCEKERSDSKLTLPIPSSSTIVTSTTSPSVQIRPVTPIIITAVNKSQDCSYKEECIKFKRKLFLPDHYFADDPICFCTACMKVRASGGDDKDNPIQGWVKFPLKITGNISTDKWHTAFYPAKMGTVRGILDKGQPYTKGQSQWGDLVVQEEDDVQVVFYPSLNQSASSYGFKLKDGSGRTAKAAFQLLVKPSAYSVSRDPLEWSTKETGAIVLHALLIQLSACC